MTKLAGCVIFNANGQLLLIHRNTPERVQWELPGGKVEPGEEPPQAAIRELKEELGIEVDVLREIGEKSFTQNDRALNYIWFLAVITAGEPKPQEAQFDDVAYFSWEELEHRHDLSTNTHNLLLAYNKAFKFAEHTKSRRMRNEQVIEASNERAKNMVSQVLTKEAKVFLPLSFDCECSDLECRDRLMLSADEYDAHHNFDYHFTIKPGHEQLDIERVVGVYPTTDAPEFCVVEKFHL